MENSKFEIRNGWVGGNPTSEIRNRWVGGIPNSEFRTPNSYFSFIALAVIATALRTSSSPMW